MMTTGMIRALAINLTGESRPATAHGRAGPPNGALARLFGWLRHLLRSRAGDR